MTFPQDRISLFSTLSAQWAHVDCRKCYCVKNELRIIEVTADGKDSGCLGIIAECGLVLGKPPSEFWEVFSIFRITFDAS